MWELVELREIRVFLALCDELHFGRTAERLRISQTRVSQTIRELETKLGTSLFDRTSRRVALTAAGRELAESVRPIDQALGRALRELSESRRGIGGVLRIGLTGPSAGGPRLASSVSSFKARHPGCTIEISESDQADPLRALRAGEVDLMAFDLPISDPQIVVGPTTRRDRRLLAVGADHPLADRAAVSIEEIADFETHDHGGNYPRESLDAWSPPRTPSGRVIRRRHLDRPSFSQIFALVSAGEIVHFASDPVFLRYPGIVYVPIDDMPPVESALIWLRSYETAAILAFADAVREQAPAEP